MGLQLLLCHVEANPIFCHSFSHFNFQSAIDGMRVSGKRNLIQAIGQLDTSDIAANTEFQVSKDSRTRRWGCARHPDAEINPTTSNSFSSIAPIWFYSLTGYSNMQCVYYRYLCDFQSGTTGEKSVNA